jgi:GDPmannose 4,6-dehydratase
VSPWRALVTGITGQDGSYLAELLLDKGYEVHGMVRRSSTETFQRLEGIRDVIVLHTGDLLDQRSLVDVLRESEPDEIYNLAAMSFVAASWNQPVLTAEFTGVGVTRMLEAMREGRPKARFYQASSSEMFGKVLEVPQRETTPSIHGRPMASPRRTATSSRSITASRTTFLPAQAYFSTTNVCMRNYLS